MLNNKTILITGGTGSFGKAFVKYAFENFPNINKIIVFSRDEQKQHIMKSEFSPKEYPIKYYLGDVRDKDRLYKISKNVDILIHSAAIKHVPAAEENPMECVKTNILGSQNIVDIAIENRIPKVVALSTDKAANPINTYGASKLLLEKLFIYANRDDSNETTKFSVVRYGNIFGSKGSVVPFFMKVKKQGFLPVTDKRMTRFSITLQESIDLVMYAIKNGWGGEIIVPIAPSYKITDIAKAIDPDLEHKEVGIRQGEKLHEVMVSEYESFTTVKRDKYYIITPIDDKWDYKEYCQKTGATKVENGFEYNSGSNTDWLSVDDIKKLIEQEEIMI